MSLSLVFTGFTNLGVNTASVLAAIADRFPSTPSAAKVIPASLSYFINEEFTEYPVADSESHEYDLYYFDENDELIKNFLLNLAKTLREMRSNGATEVELNFYLRSVMRNARLRYDLDGY